MEYNLETAKRVYADERAEDIALEMLREGDSAEKVIRITKLPSSTIQELQQQI
jgi:hypothetical protein